MRISSNYSQAAAALKLSVNSINNKVSSKETIKEKDTNRDILAISPQGKKNSMIENLMKQKQQIMDQKNKLVTSTLEKGGTMDSIKTQLEGYEEQLEQIDQQAAELMAKEVEEQAEKSKNKTDDKPKTEEEIRNNRMSNIVNLAGEIDQAETISVVKERVDGEARVKSMEMSQDSSVSIGAQNQVKVKELSELKAHSSKLAGEISENLGDITEKVKEGSEQAVEKNASNKQEETVIVADVHGKTERLRSDRLAEESGEAIPQEEDDL